MLDGRVSSPAHAFSVALGAVCVSLLALAAPALASGPATVTVRVEGVTETKLPPTQVTTGTEPVVNDGNSAHSCSGTSALGALQLATGGNWEGKWEASYNQYLIEAIEGERHEYVSGASSNYYWSFWVNDNLQEAGACQVQLNPGDRVLLFPICYEGCSGAEPTPLEIQSPASANLGESVALSVQQFNAKGEPSPANGAEITSDGTSATTDASGHATLSFSATGTHELHVTGSPSGSPSVRSEASICIHNGSDGTCGTQATSSGSSSSSSASTPLAHEVPLPPTPYRGPYALVARMQGVRPGAVYRGAQVPRLLSGTVISHNPVASVSLRLRREYRGRCSAYLGPRRRFLRARCGQASFFRVGRGPRFSYRMPSLAPGRYVLDVLASDTAGNRTRLARGSSRIVFYVR